MTSRLVVMGLCLDDVSTANDSTSGLYSTEEIVQRNWRTECAGGPVPTYGAAVQTTIVEPITPAVGNVSSNFGYCAPFSSTSQESVYGTDGRTDKAVMWL